MSIFSPMGDAEPIGRTQLDPFALWPDTVSRIAGLGGTDPSPDAVYAFHTPYALYTPGHAEFVVAFEGLTASHGNISFSINELYDAGHAAQGKIVHAPLASIAAGGGNYRMTFQAKEGVQYALMGQVYGDTDAAASGLIVEADRRDDDSPLADKLLAARESIFAGRPSGKLRDLVATGPATLANPVSQMCTAAQMDEPAYAEWVRRLNQNSNRHRKQWEFIFVCRTLEHHGALVAGRRGLGFGVGVEPLPAAFAAAGVSSVATDLPADDARAEVWSLTHQHGKHLQDLYDPAICDAETFGRHVSYEPVDMTKIPDHLRDFDFCWSSCAFEHLGSIAEGLRFVEESLKTLKPGGIAVHTTELNLTSNFLTQARGSTVLFRKRDFERLALILAAKGHRVMPLNFDQGDQPDDNYVDLPPFCSDVHLKVQLSRYVTTSFGIAVVKGQTQAG